MFAVRPEAALRLTSGVCQQLPFSGPVMKSSHPSREQRSRCNPTLTLPQAFLRSQPLLAEAAARAQLGSALSLILHLDNNTLAWSQSKQSRRIPLCPVQVGREEDQHSARPQDILRLCTHVQGH
jgi:hypothetical protein